MIVQIIKIANKIILSQNIREFKNYLRQKLNKDNTLSQIQKSTIIGNKAKEITELFKQQGLNNQNYQNKALNFIIQKTKNINNKNQLLRLVTQDLVAIIATIKNYDYIVKNMTNQLDHNQKNINNFNTYSQLFTFVNNLEEQRKSLEELQERRALGLPFKKLYSKGGFSMYEINQEDKQNFQNMFSGEDGIITKTSWCISFKDKTYFQSQGLPYYLITNKNNTAEALISIKTYQFKDVQDHVYKHNNKDVYDLLFQLLDDNNISYTDYKGQFQVLIKYLSESDKQNLISQLIQKKQLIRLFNLIKYRQLPKLSQQTNQNLISWLIQKQDLTSLFRYIQFGDLPELSQQQQLEITNNLIKTNNIFTLIRLIKTRHLLNYLPAQLNNFYNLFDDIIKDNLPKNLNKQQQQNIINYYIETECYEKIFDNIEKGKLSKLTDQQKQDIINKLVKGKGFEYLFQYIGKGYLPNNLTEQQKQQIIDWSLSDSIVPQSNIQCILDAIKSGYLPPLSTQQSQKLMDWFDAYQWSYGFLLKYIDDLILTDQQKQHIINMCINQQYLDKLFDYIKKGYLPQLNDQQKQKIRKINPNIKFSKKYHNILFSISKILKYN